MGKILRRQDPFQSFQRLLIDAGVHQRGGEVPRIRNTARIQPGFDRFLAVALFEGSEFRLRCGAMPPLGKPSPVDATDRLRAFRSSARAYS